MDSSISYKAWLSWNYQNRLFFFLKRHFRFTNVDSTICDEDIHVEAIQWMLGFWWKDFKESRNGNKWNQTPIGILSFPFRNKLYRFDRIGLVNASKAKVFVNWRDLNFSSNPTVHSSVRNQNVIRRRKNEDKQHRILSWSR